jgi:heptose I phosphotransferase
VIWIRADRRETFRGLSFDDFLALGQRVAKRSDDGRRITSWFEREGRHYFVKVHLGVGWSEIAKNWLQVKPAVTDARPEVLGLERCEDAGIGAPRLVAHGRAGLSPASRRSFVVTEALVGCTRLSGLSSALPPGLRLRLTRALGTLVGRFHATGLTHRDLYLEHVMVRFDPGARERDPELFLIDLHRVHTPTRARHARWLNKDLRALAGSARAWGATRSDLVRFERAWRRAAGPASTVVAPGPRVDAVDAPEAPAP